MTAFTFTTFIENKNESETLVHCTVRYTPSSELEISISDPNGEIEHESLTPPQQEKLTDEVVTEIEKRTLEAVSLPTYD